MNQQIIHQELGTQTYTNWCVLSFNHQRLPLRGVVVGWGGLVLKRLVFGVFL